VFGIARPTLREALRICKSSLLRSTGARAVGGHHAQIDSLAQGLAVTLNSRTTAGDLDVARQYRAAAGGASP
jgi:hypothetical protein